MANVPFVYMSVNVWRTLHPKTSVVPSLAPGMRGPFWFSCRGVPAAVRRAARRAGAAGRAAGGAGVVVSRSMDRSALKSAPGSRRETSCASLCVRARPAGRPARGRPPATRGGAGDAAGAAGRAERVRAGEAFAGGRADAAPARWCSAPTGSSGPSCSSTSSLARRLKAVQKDIDALEAADRN